MLTLHLLERKDDQVTFTDRGEHLIKALKMLQSLRDMRALALETIDIRKLIEKGEDKKTGFVSSVFWDFKKDKKDELMELSLAKTVSSFMNSEGGILLIGVGPDGEIIGLDKDFAVVGRPNKDEYMLYFTGLIRRFLGPGNIGFAKMSFGALDGKTIAIVRINKSPHPVFITVEGREEFYIRLAKSSFRLDFELAQLYVKINWS